MKKEFYKTSRSIPLFVAFIAFFVSIIIFGFVFKINAMISEQNNIDKFGNLTVEIFDTKEEYDELISTIKSQKEDYIASYNASNNGKESYSHFLKTLEEYDLSIKYNEYLKENIGEFKKEDLADLVSYLSSANDNKLSFFDFVVEAVSKISFPILIIILGFTINQRELDCGPAKYIYSGKLSNERLKIIKNKFLVYLIAIGIIFILMFPVILLMQLLSEHSVNFYLMNINANVICISYIGVIFIDIFLKFIYILIVSILVFALSIIFKKSLLYISVSLAIIASSNLLEIFSNFNYGLNLVYFGSPITISAYYVIIFMIISTFIFSLIQFRKKELY